MGPSPAKPGPEKLPGPAENIYYGVYLPPDVQPSSEDTDGSVVFTDKSEALKLVKKYKKARFKAFRSMNDATQFALFGLDSGNACPTSPPDAAEKPSPFRGPKPQDMVRFRKAIEARDLDYVKRTAWENPRYLVSSGDTPAILQEGSRYNALHIAAKARDAAVCAFVLQTIGNEAFMRHFYGDTTDVTQRCAVLLDLYLNTPDKALNETPLHFASKFGAARVVQILVAYPQCDRTATNKFHQTAKDVICSRMAGADSALKEEISLMLDEQFYVPVLRSPDHSVEPVVGKPISPFSPPQQHCGDVMSPPLEVQAVAGPMPRHTAELFRRRWKTPPRLPGSPLLARRPTLIDQDKGWEKVGRELAQEWKVAWKEYWPFLDTYTDLNTPEGLQMLEDFLQRRFRNASPPSSQPVTPPVQVNGVVSAESPMTELCSALRACRLSSGKLAKPVSRHPPPPRPTAHHNGDVRHTDDTLPAPSITSPHLYMEKSCQVFAKRIVDGFHLQDEELEFLWVEIKHLDALISSCKSDNRFSQLDFHRLHSRLGQLVAQLLDPTELIPIKASLHSLITRRMEECFSSDEEELDSPYLRRPRVDRRDRQTLHNAVVCVASAVLAALDTPEDTSQPAPATEQTCANVWAHATCCSCTFLTNRHFRRKFSQKKLDFKDDEFGEINSGEPKASEEGPACGIAPADSSGEESDTSDTSDGEFFTPPSSPGIRSDDDLAMESPDEGPDVYISGNMPSKLDIAVMEAIRHIDLNKAKYPNICRWRHLVLLHSEHERQSWLSTPKHKSSPGTPPPWNMSPANSPLWHRSPSLHND